MLREGSFLSLPILATQTIAAIERESQKAGPAPAPIRYCAVLFCIQDTTAVPLGWVRQREREDAQHNRRERFRVSLPSLMTDGHANTRKEGGERAVMMR